MACSRSLRFEIPRCVAKPKNSRLPRRLRGLLSTLQRYDVALTWLTVPYVALISQRYLDKYQVNIKSSPLRQETKQKKTSQLHRTRRRVSMQEEKFLAIACQFGSSAIAFAMPIFLLREKTAVSEKSL